MDHAAVVLAGIIPGRRDSLLYALQHLTPEHFRVTEQRNLFQMLERYHDVAGDILPRDTLTDLLSRGGTDVAKTVLYEALFDEVYAKEVAQHEFRYAIDALKDIRAEQLTGEALTTALEILDNGAEVDRVEKKGHRDAREYAYSELTRIDKLGSIEATPEGDMRHDSERLISAYADRKSGKTVSGLTVGIDAIDRHGGWGNGELILVTAYTGEGKSQLCTQAAWYNVIHGKNVFFATSETVRDQVMRRMVARHTRHPMFGRPDGIDSNQIKNGSLSDEDEKVFLAAWDDLKHNPTYGKAYICQVPRSATLSYVEARMNRQAASWQIDLAIIDYIALLKAETKRQKAQEEYNDMLKDSKTLATSHDQGRGVPLVSPWAMSQAAWKRALGKDGSAGSGEYSLGGLAETSEAEKSPDQIITLLRMPETPSEVKLAYLKNRDGDLPQPSTLEVDYRNAYLTDKKATSNTDLFESY